MVGVDGTDVGIADGTMVGFLVGSVDGIVVGFGVGLQRRITTTMTKIRSETQIVSNH